MGDLSLTPLSGTAADQGYRGPGHEEGNITDRHSWTALCKN